MEPSAKAVGTRFENKKTDPLKPAFIVRLQCKFPYVPILKTLESAFKNQMFLETYIDYNKNGGNGHSCKQMEYIDFCCGTVYKKNELFQKNPNALQIQIFCDDFEPCNPLGSKATIHKMCGIYFCIRNMPNNSKLNNIYLVALCNTDDLKTKETDFNDIWRIILNEIRHLEAVGITVANGINLKGSLVITSADNLEQNQSLGFVESFVSTHFCRICDMPKNLCQIECEENPSSLRTIASYEKSLSIAKNSTKVDFSKTKGVKRDCDLNKLEYFHIMQNKCVDPMHDLPEGVVSFALLHLFKFLTENNICPETRLVQLIQFFDYGVLNRKNVPSAISLTKQNLNQSAAQCLCLFRNIHPT